jgi:peptidoglycan/LPS O-acetylase OafA/YrhL
MTERSSASETAVARTGRRIAHGGKYLPELDGLRAIAVTLVVTEHMQVAIFERLVGRLGVIVFFVLSGYLITSLALAEESKTGSLSFRGFYIRRTFRIFPAYYVVLAIYCFLILGLHVSPEKKIALQSALPFYVSYLQEIPFLSGSAGRSLPFYQSWSLGIEEKFYLVWPVVCFLALRRKPNWRIPAAILLIAGVSFSRYTRPYISILFGCLLALCFANPRLRVMVERMAPAGSWAGLGLLVAFQLAVMPRWTWAFADYFYAALFCAFLALLLTSNNALKKGLSIKPLTFIGKISYGVYLVHLLCVGAVRDFLPLHNPLMSFVVVCVASFTIAAILHYTLEKPLIEVGRSLSRKAPAPRDSFCRQPELQQE